MKLIKKIIGVFMILGLIAISFWTSVIAYGLLNTLLRIAFGLVITAAICIGVLLIFDDW